MNVTDWLLDSDPAIRWQVQRDLLDEPASVWEAERAKIATHGWGKRLLDLEDEDGQWAGGALFPRVDDGSPGQPWTATSPTLQLLRDFGIDPSDERVSRGIALIRENSKWEHDGQRFFDGEVEPCINGRTVATGVYFGEDVAAIVERLLDEQLDDGGWNCEMENGSVRSSFDSTIEVLDGLLEFEQRFGGPRVQTAIGLAHAYLLDRHLMRRLSTGDVLEKYTTFSYPFRWHYDVLRGLDHLRAAGVTPDERWDDALELVRSKRQPDGRWLLENSYRGSVHFELDDGDGKPSRWNTLRALRVLEYVDG
jgi:hypothetical protein